MASVAAPLLAGFAFTFMGLVLSANEDVRWVDAAVALLMLSALLLITTVQFAFSAKRYYIAPTDWESWEHLADDTRTTDFKRQAAFFLERHGQWLTLTRYAYNLGILALFAAIAVALVPTEDPSGWRLTAIALAVFGFAGEVVWTFWGEIQKLRGWRVRRRAG